MNCRDFEPSWNDWLDDRLAGDPKRLVALEDHASTCPRCLPVHLRYLLLSQALRVVVPVVFVSEGFVERVLAETATAPSLRSGRVHPRIFLFSGFAAAAALLLAVSLGFRSLMMRTGPTHLDRPITVQNGARPARLTEALAVATSATWELAREASRPAARVGLELASEELPALAPSPSLGISVDLAITTDALQRVGDRLNAGVRPLEGTARRAFGFILSTNPDNARPAPRSPRGA